MSTSVGIAHAFVKLSNHINRQVALFIEDFTYPTLQANHFSKVILVVTLLLHSKLYGFY